MTALATTRRSLCAQCARPSAMCICSHVVPVACAVELLILQHPMEVPNAKGSARLLHMSVARSALVAGEQFEPGQLAGLLHQGDRIPLLLYPDTPDERSLGLPTPPALDAALLANPGALRLVVLDATWRKSRKMLYQNRLLQALPRLALTSVPASRYRIRKAHAADQLSTLEASVYALGQLEGDATKFAALLDGFDGFVAQLAAREQTRA